MIDPEGSVADAFRTLWIWVLISPGLSPATELLPEIGFLLDVPVPDWAGIVVAGLVAGMFVGVGERRYRRVFFGSLLVVVLWVGFTDLLGLTGNRVFGTPRIVAAQLLLWIAVVSLSVAIVFYTGDNQGIGTAVDDAVQ
jgi:hypothetical protein